MTNESEDIRLIKKYPNRRLYDTEESKYITLDDACQMVIDEVPFKVVDQKTGEDLTRSILLQIIMEQENSGESLFGNDVLSEFIRHYSESGRENFTGFLQASMKMFSEQQANLIDQMGKGLQGSPMDFWMGVTRQNMENFQQMQEKFFGANAGGEAKDK